MKKIIVSLLACILFTVGISAVGTFEYILPAEFERIEYGSFYGSGRYIKAFANGKEALYDFDGKLIIGGYDSIGMHENGMGVGKRGDKYDVINYQGKVLSTYGKNFISLSGLYVFVDLGGNIDGRPLKFYEGNFAIYDYNGNLLKVLPYADYLPESNLGYGLSFEGGRLVFIENGKYGALNESFEVVIDAEYDAIFEFASDRYSTVAVKDGKYGIIDNDGKVLTPFEYGYITPMYNEQGEFCCYMTEKYGNIGSYGYIDGDGATVLFEPMLGVVNISYDYSLVLVSKENEREDRGEYRYLYGLTDFSGREVLPIEYTGILSIENGIICAQKSYDCVGYYDLLGREISEFKYRMATPFSEGYAFAANVKEGVWTNEVLNLDGGVAFCTDSFSQGFKQGIALLENGEFIDKNGNTVYIIDGKAESSYADFGYSEDEGLYTVNKGNLKGVLKYTPKAEEPAWDYEYIDDYGNLHKIIKRNGGYELIMKDGTSRYIDFKGKETDNTVEILGTNFFYGDDGVEVRYDDNSIIKTLKDGEYLMLSESDLQIAIVYEREVLLYDRTPSCEVIHIVFLEGEPSLAEFYIGNNGYYYKDVNGGYYISKNDKKYDAVWFLGDEFVAKRGGGWYIVNGDGKEINKEPFSVKPDIYADCPDYYVIGTKIFDRALNLVLDIGERKIRNIVGDGFIIVYDSEMKKLGVMNMKGETVIESTKTDISYLGNGLFKVYESGLYSVVHSSGRVFAFGCTYVTDMGDNGYVGISKGNFEGYIDETGRVKLTLPKGYYVQGTFSEGVASVVRDLIYSRYGRVSYIDQSGRIVLESNGDTWCYGNEFEGGIAIVGTHLGKAGPQGFQLIKCLYDTPSDWAGESVVMAIYEGVLEPDLQQRYRKNITREHFCEIVYGLLVVKKVLDGVSIDGITFTDTDNEKIMALSAAGIIFGVGDGRFAPDEYITREEVATVLSRVYRFIGEISEEDGYKYDDDGSISAWAKESVYAMRLAGIMQGVGDNMFSPKALCTTEQTIVATMRLFKK